MSTFADYASLLGHVDAWTINDLGDMMVEIERDRDLAAQDRKDLLDRLYRVLWRRAQEELGTRKPDDGSAPEPT